MVTMTFGIEEPVLFGDEFLSLRREEVKDMLTHAFGSYMSHGYPADEVKPISCRPHNMFLADGGGSGEWESYCAGLLPVLCTAAAA